MKLKLTILSILIMLTAPLAAETMAVDTMAADTMEADTSAAKVLKIDADQSSVQWTGRKVTGAHTGKLGIKMGSIKMEGGKVVDGEFSFDMAAIDNEDLTDPEYKKKLEDHLKSDDFFSVSEHPTASFKINSVSSPSMADNTYNVDGVLTIKGISHPLSFVSTITENEKDHRANAIIKFDRTKWDVKYNSGKFFSLAALGDKLIYDEIEIELNVVAPKSMDS